MKNIIRFILVSVILSGCSARLSTDERIQLEKQLKEMVDIDQIAAGMPSGKYMDLPHEAWNSFKDSVFTVHKNFAEEIFNKYGFPGFDLVSKESSSHFWLIVQHCDKYPEFQQRVLKAMDKQVKNGNARPQDYALLYDRVKVNAGEKQLFGTQVTYEVETTGRAIPKIGLADSVNVDSLRKHYNLEPLKDYLNMMTTFHWEMNKEQYQKKGISAPNLY